MVNKNKTERLAVYIPAGELELDSDMLDANEKYFVSTRLTDFNYRHLLSKLKMNKSVIADMGDFP